LTQSLPLAVRALPYGIILLATSLVYATFVLLFQAALPMPLEAVGARTAALVEQVALRGASYAFIIGTVFWVYGSVWLWWVHRGLVAAPAIAWRRLAAQTVLLVAVAIQFWSRWHYSADTLSFLTGKSGLVMAVIGILTFHLTWSLAPERMHKILFPFSPVSSEAKQNTNTWVLLLITVGILLLTLTTVLPQVLRYWDNSGWMDSHNYDILAHDIVTGRKPWGNGYYMPVFQYGMAALYAVFGHFFFIQQLANVALALVTVTLLCGAAWVLFESVWAVAFVGGWVAMMPQLRHAVFYTQIENWYLPIISLLVFAAARYLRYGQLHHMAFIGLCAGLAINTRTQGAFMVGFILLAPLFVGGFMLSTRVRHIVIGGLVFVFTLIPWTARNYIVEGRFTPNSQQSTELIAVMNDPRIGLYGVRYDLGFSEIAREWRERYPDSAERAEAQRRYTNERLLHWFTHPTEFATAVFWRGLAFYGLIPPGAWAPQGPQPTNWSVHLQDYLYTGIPAFLMLGSMALALLIGATNRIALFFAGAIIANFALVFIVGSGEPRISYPSYPFHILLAAMILFRLAPAAAGAAYSAKPLFSRRPLRNIGLVSLAAVTALCVALHLTIGKQNRLRPLWEKAVYVVPGTQIDATLPRLGDSLKSVDDKALAMSPPVRPGERVIVSFTVSNYMLPPKFHQPMPYMHPPATDPRGPHYFYAYESTPGLHHEGRRLGVTFFGATLSEMIHEGDTIEAEGVIEAIRDPQIDPTRLGPLVWMRILKTSIVSKEHVD